MRPHAETNWREPTYTDDGLEQVVDTAAADTLMSRIAIALATSTALKGRPDAVMRNWRVLMARMDGQTLDQIAAAEGRSREWIRQILRQTRQIVSAKPGLFDGHGGLTTPPAARCGTAAASRSWRLGYTNDPRKQWAWPHVAADARGTETSACAHPDPRDLCRRFCLKRLCRCSGSVRSCCIQSGITPFLMSWTGPAARRLHSPRKPNQ